MSKRVLRPKDMCSMVVVVEKEEEKLGFAMIYN